MSSSLVHNKTYAHRLPPTFLEQARGLANLRENMVFSDSSRGGVGNSESFLSHGDGWKLTTATVASRTALSSILKALERIAFNGDPLQFMVIETTYQPFISFFHQTDILDSHPELAAIRTSSPSSSGFTPLSECNPYQ